MVETPEDEVTQNDTEEVEETTEEDKDSSSLNDETTDAETTQDDIIVEVEADHSAILAPFGADLEFLHGDNMSFYQANKAYYEDQNYEEAISEFQAAIEYERLHPPDPPDSEDSDSEDSEDDVTPRSPNEITAKSMYWIGEAYIKLNQIDKAVETFQQLSKHFRQHYLVPAAQRRIASLTLHEESESV